MGLVPHPVRAKRSRGTVPSLRQRVRPPPLPPPVAIDIKPQPIETQARVYLRYAIGG
jgi:hypothetical protein